MKLIDLFEGRHDPHIFKAIFMAGGPGSGKSYIAQFLKGGTGLKYINVDSFTELLAPKLGVSMTGQYGGEFHKKTRGLMKNRKSLGIQGRLGLLLDGTGRDAGKIIRAKNDLEDIGYDTAMVFVNTDIDTASSRNQQRERSVDDDFLRKAHKRTKDNLDVFNDVFGTDLIIIDNSKPKTAEYAEYLKGHHLQAWKHVRKFLEKPNQAAMDFQV